MEERGQFTFYRSFYEAVLKLPRSKQLGVLLAIVEFGLDGIEPEGLDNIQAGYFIMARPNLSTSRRKAESGAEGGSKNKSAFSKKESKKKKEKKIETEIENKTETEGFDRFWQRYPVQIGKAAAEAAWVCVINKHDAQFVLNRLEEWIDSKTWAAEDGRYVPKPEKWLEEEWFLRSPPQAVPKGASGKLGQAELEAIQQLLKEDQV